MPLFPENATTWSNPRCDRARFRHQHNTLVVTRAPVITDFSPGFGSGGVPVTISGINFQNVQGVSFNGVSATGFGTPAENQINAIVPANATTGPIRVTNAFGVGVSSQPFVITIRASHHEPVADYSQGGRYLDRIRSQLHRSHGL